MKPRWLPVVLLGLAGLAGCADKPSPPHVAPDAGLAVSGVVAAPRAPVQLKPTPEWDVDFFAVDVVALFSRLRRTEVSSVGPARTGAGEADSGVERGLLRGGRGGPVFAPAPHRGALGRPRAGRRRSARPQRRHHSHPNTTRTTFSDGSHYTVLLHPVAKRPFIATLSIKGGLSIEQSDENLDGYRDSVTESDNAGWEVQWQATRPGGRFDRLTTQEVLSRNGDMFLYQVTIWSDADGDGQWTFEETFQMSNVSVD